MNWRARTKTVLGVALLGAIGWMAGAVLLNGRGIEAAAPTSRLMAATEDEGWEERLLVPVAGVRREALVDTWGQSRAGGARAHEAIDIMARRGTPVLAAAAGTVEKLFQSARGGITCYVRSPDRRRIYYYAHLDRYAPDLAERKRVRAGDLLGFVGSTGDAAPTAPHLHFAIELVEPGEGWWQGRAVNPYPLLRPYPELHQ